MVVPMEKPDAKEPCSSSRRKSGAEKSGGDGREGEGGGGRQRGAGQMSATLPSRTKLEAKGGHRDRVRRAGGRSYQVVPGTAPAGAPTRVVGQKVVSLVKETAEAARRQCQPARGVEVGRKTESGRVANLPRRMRCTEWGLLHGFTVHLGSGGGLLDLGHLACVFGGLLCLMRKKCTAGMCKYIHVRAECTRNARTDPGM